MLQPALWALEQQNRFFFHDYEGGRNNLEGVEKAHRKERHCLKSGRLGSTSQSLEEVRGHSKQHVLHREQRHQRSWRSEVQEREAGVAAPEGVSSKVLTDWKAHACY